jgi:hypothetical protein
MAAHALDSAALNELIGVSALMQTQIDKNHIVLRLSSDARPPD